MARIVGVHGVGYQFQGEHQVHSQWLPALKDGLALASRKLTSDNDFVCASYGTLFRPKGKAGGYPPLDASDVTDGWEREMLELWWSEAVETDPAVSGPEERTKLRTPNIVQRALNALSRSRFFADLSERALIFDLKQVYRYLHEPEVRETAQASLERVVSSETTVIIAHSLGSIVAYEALCRHPEWPVRTFVTIGSPLGIGNLIFDKLRPSPEDGVGVWPSGITQWFNIADKGDVVALVKDLASRFGPHVTDRLVYNGVKAHDATHYLTSKEVGDAVSSGL